MRYYRVIAGSGDIRDPDVFVLTAAELTAYCWSKAEESKYDIEEEEYFRVETVDLNAEGFAFFDSDHLKQVAFYGYNDIFGWHQRGIMEEYEDVQRRRSR